MPALVRLLFPDLLRLLWPDFSVPPLFIELLLEFGRESFFGSVMLENVGFVICE